MRNSVAERRKALGLTQTELALANPIAAALREANARLHVRKVDWLETATLL